MHVLDDVETARPDGSEQSREGRDLIASAVAAVVDDEVERAEVAHAREQVGVGLVAAHGVDPRTVDDDVDDVDAVDLGLGEVVAPHLERGAAEHADLEHADGAAAQVIEVPFVEIRVPVRGRALVGSVHGGQPRELAVRGRRQHAFDPAERPGASFGLDAPLHEGSVQEFAGRAVVPGSHADLRLLASELALSSAGTGTSPGTGTSAGRGRPRRVANNRSGSLNNCSRNDE